MLYCVVEDNTDDGQASQGVRDFDPAVLQPFGFVHGWVGWGLAIGLGYGLGMPFIRKDTINR